MRQETTESILKKYKKVTPSEARAHWNEQYVKSAVECTHVYRQAHCVNARNCEVGLRTRKFYILGRLNLSEFYFKKNFNFNYQF